MATLSQAGTDAMFGPVFVPFPVDSAAHELRVQVKTADAYGWVHGPSQPAKAKPASAGTSSTPLLLPGLTDASDSITQDITGPSVDSQTGESALIVKPPPPPQRDNLLMKRPRRVPIREPVWHAPWKLHRVISGHLGWVRCAAVDVSNEWFATGSADRTIKIWDLASGHLKLTLTGHIHSVRGVAVSDRHPYLFSVGEDKMVKNWDLETNRVIRSYHGHLSGIYALALHPTLDVLVTGGRDSTARVWDMRTKAQVHVLSGHSHTVAAIRCQGTAPQVITGSHDSTIRQWDLASGRTRQVLTNHKKSVRALALHPSEYTYASGAADNIKVWQCPDGVFLRNLSGHNSIVNAINVNSDDVLVSGGDDGSLKFWDWKSGYAFQTTQSIVQPGSLDAEAAIFAIEWDRTGTRMITCEADKTVKIWREDPDATRESHPIDPEFGKEQRAKRRELY
uniref:Uncharacterized protein n=1 Tax=Spongospora subterranea TaxID=70186 RepID=A0A0H5R809_9EUKA|eukprot:CRZ10268.1 hypothetical protein [Spongospora subterranea]